MAIWCAPLQLCAGGGKPLDDFGTKERGPRRSGKRDRGHIDCSFRVAMRIHRVALSLVLVALSAISISAAPSGPKAFANSWDGRTVALTRPLYSLVFDERSRALPLFKRQGRVAGLTVGTPSDTYYQFDARRESEDDIIERDPNRLLTQLRTQYRRSTHLDIGNVQDVEGVLLVRYEPGVRLVVRKVQFERDRMRLVLNKPEDSDLATTLTVKWPAPWSKDLTEATLIDGVLSRFVTKVE
jgi:hypothetical protein